MTELDPDQLLQSMDLQIAAARFRRSSADNSKRNAIRMAGILVLVIGTALALLALQYFAMEFKDSRPPAAQTEPR